MTSASYTVSNTATVGEAMSETLINAFATDSVSEANTFTVTDNTDKSSRWCSGVEGVEHSLTHRHENSSYTFAPKPQVWDYFCGVCGLNVMEMPRKVRASIDPIAAKEVAYAMEHCRNGHEYEIRTITTSLWNGGKMSTLQQVCRNCNKRNLVA